MTLIIAEIGQAHEGSLGILHSYIDALADTGVDAIKFQMHIAEAESSIYEPFRVKFSFEDETRYDYWKRMEFTPEQWKGIKEHCDEVGLEFMCSPFSIAAVNLLEEIGVKRYKIGSGEVSNLLLLEKLRQIQKPVILSSGMSAYEEIDKSVEFLKEQNIDVSILQCTTSYPTQPHQIGLNVIEELKNRYELPVGLSDHSGEIYAMLAAVAIGAKLLEFHVVFDKRMFGPDAKASLTIEQTKQLVVGVRNIEEMLNNPIDKNNISQFSELKVMFEKSLAINKDLKVGDKISLDDLEAKKPKGKGINAGEFQSVIGKTLKNDQSKYEFLNWDDLQ